LIFLAVLAAKKQALRRLFFVVCRARYMFASTLLNLLR